MYPNKRSSLTLTFSFPVTEWFVSLRLLSDDEPAQVRGVLINFTTKSYRWIPKYYTNAKDRSEKDGQTVQMTVICYTRELISSIVKDLFA